MEDNKCTQRTGCPTGSISSSQADCESKIVNWCLEDNKCTQRSGCPQGNIRTLEDEECKSKIVSKFTCSRPFYSCVLSTDASAVSLEECTQKCHK